jgi:acid phosphatase type 7
MFRLRFLASVTAGLMLLAGCSGSDSHLASAHADSSSTSPSATPTSGGKAGTQSVKVVAVGDIACDPTSPYFHGVPGYCEQNRVGKLVGQLVKQGASYFLPLGDEQYEEGTYSAFKQVYDKAFGRFKNITYPVAGNHEWVTPHAAGYFKYFGKRAGTPKKPWRAFSPVKGWLVLLLDSNCEFVGGCGKSSPQGKWIQQKLAKTHAQCVMATMHHPRRTSGEYHGITNTINRAKRLWASLTPGGADLVLNGHDHIYERFRKFSGVQQFTVGTGGKNHYEITVHSKGSQKVFNNHYGVLELTLSSNGTYDYAFHSVNGKVLDSGSERCTNSPAKP